MTDVLHHVEINVSNLKEALSFWQWFLADLGYELYQTWEDGQSWKYEETYLVFVQAQPQFLDAPYHRGQVGLNHLAFHAKSRAHVDDMTMKLRARGATILYEDRHPYAGGPAYYAVFFEGPDRMKLELVAPEGELLDYD